MQMQQSECGLCCMAMVLGKYKKKKSIYELRNEFTIGRDGLNLSILKRYMQKEQMDSKIYYATMEGLQYLTTPFIALWQNSHFVVVDRIHKGKFSVLDPGIGRIQLKSNEFVEGFSGYVLDAIPNKSFQKENSNHKNPWRQLLLNLRSRKVLCLGIIMMTFLTMLSQLLIPIITQHFIDGISIAGNMSYISQFIWITLAVSLLFLIISLFREVMMNRMNVFLSKIITKDVFSHLLKLPYKFYDVRSPGDLLYRLNSIVAIRELISNSIIPGIVTLGTAFAIAIYLFFKSVTMGSMVMVMVLINFTFLFFTRRKVSNAVDNELIQQSKNQSTMAEILYSIIFIKMSNSEKNFLKQWEETFDNAIAAFLKRSDVQAIINSISSAFQMLAPLLIMAYGFFLLLHNQLTLGEVIAIQSVSSTLFSHMNNLFSSYTQLITTDSYLKRILDITLAKKEEKDTATLLGSNDEIEKIELQNIEFQYSDFSEPVLNDISFQIKKGQKIGIVGESGSGKSTLAKLLTGLYQNTAGEIVVNESNQIKINNILLQKKIAIVPQDILLFNKSIYDNITMGNQDYTMDEVHNVAKMANIHQEIESMPMGYDTMVSDMGLNLSGGQRQRITLARSLIRKPDMLILDEATSSLDNRNEHIISEYLEELKCTTIVIAHRMSTIKGANKIIVLDQGEVVDSGTHDQLIDQCKFYRELYNIKE